MTDYYDGDDLCPDCGGEGYTYENDPAQSVVCPRCEGGGTIAVMARPPSEEEDKRCDSVDLGTGDRCLLTLGHRDPHFYAFDLPSDGVPEGIVTGPSIIHPESYGTTAADFDLSIISDPTTITTSAVHTGATITVPVLGPHPPEVDRIAGLARGWKDDPSNRRAYLKAFSEAVVDLRQCFTVSHDGGLNEDPDWRGRNGDYRDSINEAQHRSAIGDAAWKKLTGGARYHIGAIVRARATPPELERAGLTPLTPQERGRIREHPSTLKETP